MSVATEVLWNHQGQADQDGVMVIVSRQAIDETLTEYANLVATVETLQSFIGIMFGRGPDAIIPETVDAPVGVPIKTGDMMRAATSILETAKAV